MIQRSVDLLEDVEWLIDQGMSPALVAQQVHRRPGSIARLAGNHGRTDLAAIFYGEVSREKAAA